MQDGQASVEYALLVTALVVGMCLLVRFSTPVEAVARAVAHAATPGDGRYVPAHRVRGTPRRPPHRHEHRCLCR